MTLDQFNQWLIDFQTRFPDSGKWLAANRPTVWIWFEDVFCKLDFDAAMQASRELMTSDEPIRAYERETIPARVSSIARRIAWGKSESRNEWRKNCLKQYQPAEGEKRLRQVLAEAMAKKDTKQ